MATQVFSTTINAGVLKKVFSGSESLEINDVTTGRPLVSDPVATTGVLRIRGRANYVTGVTNAGVPKTQSTATKY